MQCRQNHFTQRDPDTGFEFAIDEAKRVVALGGSGQVGR
jgi:hypothetical protein